MDITLFGIFVEGLLSFLSPCVLPLIPLYMSYLAGEDKEVDKNGNVKYKTLKVFITTVFFVLGIFLTFIILSLSVGFIAEYLEKYKEVIYIIGGTLLIIFGLHQIGLFKIDLLNKEYKLKVNLHLEKMNFFKAFLLGFVFSLGWSPCIGPMLSNAIIMASTSTSGYLYILVYALGLIIPFLITGLLTSAVLNFINSKKKIISYVIKVSGIILICFGIYMINTAYKDINNLKNIDQEINIMDYEFLDQNGSVVKLSDFKGKYIYLNFVASWCTYCKEEIPAYHEFANNNDDFVCLYVMSLRNERNANDIATFIRENNIQLLTLRDNEGLLLSHLGISSYPTIYVVDPDNEFLSYYSGMLDIEGFNNLRTFSIDLYKDKQ